MMIIELEVQSMSDIITNSSSEVFLVETEKSAKEIFDEILSWGILLSINRSGEAGDEWCSGTGGEICVKDNKSVYTTYNYPPDAHKPRPAKWIEDNKVLIDIDWSRRDTIEKIEETFKPTRID